MSKISEWHGMTGISGKIKGLKMKKHFVLRNNNTEICINADL